MNASKAFYKGVKSSRKSAREERSNVKAVRITKKGTESKIESDTKHFANLTAANEYTAKSVGKYNIYQKVDGKYSLVAND